MYTRNDARLQCYRQNRERGYMLGGLRRRHQRGLKLRFRNSRLLIAFWFFLFLLLAYPSLTLWFAAQTLSSPLSCFERRPNWDVNWAERRTILFTTVWLTHKLRNFAIYFCLSTRHIFILKNVVYHTMTCPDVLYDERYDILFEAPKACFSHACLKRFGASHYVYAEFVLRTFDAVTKTKIEPPKPTTQGKVAVLVEPREHPLLEYTVKQVMLTLGPTWSLQIFVSSST